MDKQILAVCEIADHKVRLIVAEFFHTSLNILKVEQVPTTGFDGRFVLDEEAIIKSLQSALFNASKNLQASIERVLLVIPSLGMQKYTEKLYVEIADPERGISVKDIQKTHRMLMDSDVKVDKEIIFAHISRYLVNGIPFRKAPIGERATKIQVEADIYAADKALAYQLAGCVEKAGCEIMDVILDGWALAKETAIIEPSQKNVMIAIRLDKTSTQLSLFYHGKLIASEWLEIGSGQWIRSLSEFFRLPEDVATRLLYYNCDLKEKEYSTHPVYLWAVKEQSKTCSQAEIMEIVYPQFDDWRKQLIRMCEPIIEKRTTELLITGEGSLIEGIDTFIQEAFDSETRLYVPETIGARDPGLTVALGAFYAYQDLEPWQRQSKQAVNVMEFEEMIGSRKVKEPTGELAISKKIKSILQTKKD